MLLYFIRHGKPDYRTDVLLEEGRRQAELVSDRLVLSGVDRIYSSPMGRALQTAAPTAEKLGLPIRIEWWARELGRDTYTTYSDGVPKTVSLVPNAHLHQPAYRTIPLEECFRECDGLRENRLGERYQSIADGLDGLLAREGYAVNGDGLWEPVEPNSRHIAFFCHLGMMRCMVSHLLHLPYQFVAASLSSHFTGVTLFEFPSGASETTSPRLISYGDVGHLYAEGKELTHFSFKERF